ncbi:MAG: glycosyltransferase family 4 protein [Planctomycetota bacterium]
MLVIAEACNPEWVSVPLVGWSHYAALREVADVHLVTQVRNCEALTRAGLVEGDDFTAIDSEKIVKPIWNVADTVAGKGKGWTIRQAAMAAAYPYFERLLWKTFGPKLRAGAFDLVHQITPLSPTNSPKTASRCAKIGVPFVWGPLNGGAPWPKEFQAEQRQEREYLASVRGAFKLLPGYASARRSASAIVCGSRHTLSEMPDDCRDRCVYLPENGIDPSRFTARRTRTAGDGPLRLVSIGRLVPYKGHDMAIQAAEPLLRDGRATLTIYGEGPMRPELEKLADGLPNVSMPGWVKHHEVPDVLADADLLIFPSIREFGGGVALEAMAVGLPVACVDYAGPPELVTDDVGWLVPMGNRAAIVRDFQSLMTILADDPSPIEAKGKAAKARVDRLFTWQAKAKQTLSIYDAVLAGRALPDFGMPLS